MKILRVGTRSLTGMANYADGVRQTRLRRARPLKIYGGMCNAARSGIKSTLDYPTCVNLMTQHFSAIPFIPRNRYLTPPRVPET